MKLLFSRYANVYKSSRILFLNSNLYKNMIIKSLNDLLYIVYYLLFILNVHDYKKEFYLILIVQLRYHNLIFEKL